MPFAVLPGHETNTGIIHKPFGGPEDWPDLIPVEQIDRETAVLAGRTWAHWTDGQITKALEGRGDYAPLIQLMARHRLAVLAAQGMPTQGAETA